MILYLVFRYKRAYEILNTHPIHISDHSKIRTVSYILELRRHLTKIWACVQQVIVFQYLKKDIKIHI